MYGGDQMAYRISYGTDVPKQYHKQRIRNPFRLQVMTAACLVLFTLLVGRFIPAGQNVLRNCLLPDSGSVTQQALDRFVADLRQGMAVGDALFTFCETVISSDPAISG